MRRDNSTFESSKIREILRAAGGVRRSENFGSWYVKLTDEVGFFVPADKTQSFRTFLTYLDAQHYDRTFAGVAWLRYTMLYLKVWRNVKER